MATKKITTNARYKGPDDATLRRRINGLGTALLVFTYAVVGIGGGWLFMRLVHQPTWFEIFVSIWWMPSGFLALWIRNAFVDRMLRGTFEPSIKS